MIRHRDLTSKNLSAGKEEEEDRQICLQKKDIFAMINDVQLVEKRYSNDLSLRDMYIQTRQANV